MGTTIGTVLISYDVDTNHQQVKTFLENLDYSDNWFYQINPDRVYYLPNTTLMHLAKSSDQAMIDLRTACNRSGARLLRAVTVLASEFVGI